MKKLGVAAFITVLSVAAAFGLAYKRPQRAAPAVSAAVIESGEIKGPNSITYIGNNRLIVADEQGIKQFDIVTEIVTPLFPTDEGGTTSYGSAYGFTYSTNIVFHKETNTLFLQANGNPDVVYSYREDIEPKNQTLTRAEVDAILYSEQELADGRTISDKANNEDVTDIIGQPLPNTFVYEGTPPPMDITVDRYNRMVYYLDNVVTWSAKIRRNNVPTWWSFDDHKTDHYEWDTDDAIENGDSLFATAKENAFIYQYPSSETPKEMLNAITPGRTVILLNQDNSPEFGEHTFDEWRYVLYEIDSKTYEIGYVLRDRLTLYEKNENNVYGYQIEDLANDARAKTAKVDFKPKSAGMGQFIGRVIRYEIPIYRYPTCVINTLTVGTRRKTIKDGTNSLPLQYLIEITDMLGGHYFQITAYDTNGIETGVGFVQAKAVIDINAESEFEPVIPNAKIVGAPADGLKIYKDAAGTEELTEITLPDGAEIRIITDKKSGDLYRRTAAYNKIYYNDPEIGKWWQIVGYIETKYIKPEQSSLSPAQWIGLSMLGVVLVGVLSGFIIAAVTNAKYEKKKREMNAMEYDAPEVTA